MFLLITTLFFVILYLYGTRNYNYWKKRGVIFEEPIIFFGSSLKPFTQRLSFSERFANFYKAYPNDKYVGFFHGNDPAILIRDPGLIKHVLVSDFKNFHYRGFNPTQNNIEPLFKNLFTVDGDIWKLMRQKLTPAFSSSKLKGMFPLIIDRAEKLIKIVDNFTEKRDEIDVRELMARYTTDFIGACGFGIDSDSLNDESSDFRKLGKRIITITPRDTILFVLKRFAPKLFNNFTFLAPEIERKTLSIVKQIMSQRNYKPSGRNDFIDMMLELKQKQKIIGESIEKRNSDGTPVIIELELDDLLLTAQVFIFFVAGFETSSSASSFLLHLLAYHPDHQTKCQQEVDEVLQKYDGRLCFDAVKEMKYLEICFKESLRILPSPGFLFRKCIRNSTLPGTKLTLEKGTLVIISTEGLNYDEQYFDKPEEFRPERFHPENIGNNKRNVYMPFGDGPRSCIGERMGIMQSLAGVATILHNFTLAPSRSSVRKPRIDPSSSLLQSILGGLPLSLKRRRRFE